VILLGAHAYPDPAIGSRRLSEFARHLSEQGWEVHLIAQAGPFPRSGGTLAPAVVRHDIEFPAPLSRRLTDTIRSLRQTPAATTRESAASRSPPAGSSGARPALATRLRDWMAHHYFRFTVAVDSYKRWSLHAARKLAQLVREHRPAAIFASGPPFSPLAGAALVARLRRIPFVIDLRDPWMNRGAVVPRDYAGLRRRLDSWLESRCIGLATYVVTTSQLTQQLHAHYPAHAAKIVTVRNGYEDGMLMEPPAFSGRLIMLYAGTIYLNRDPMPFFEALSNLQRSGSIDPQRICVRFVGDCQRWRDIDLQAWLSQRGLDRIVELRAPVPSAQIAALTREANVLINFAQKQPDSVPAKLFEQIASRRQVLLFTESDSESANVAGNSPQVLRLEGDIAEIEAAIRRLYAQWVEGTATATVDDSMLAELGRRHSNEHLERLLRAPELPV
jgi:Glycosyl transferase 4-like domain